MRSLRGVALGAVLAVFSLVAFADRGPEPAPTAQNVVRTTVLLPDGGAPIWYVNMAGNDARDCMSPATACATPQGAINKIPKMLRHQATVSIDAGTYPGFIVSGFSADNGFQQTTGGLLIDGALDLAKPLTGTATGIAQSGTAGSGSTFGTLVDNAQAWTTNDLTGRFISTTSPTNTMLVISSNTATSITVVGTWSVPTGATNYSIYDSTAVINTAVSLPATPTSSLIANRAAILIAGNMLAYRANATTIRNIRTTNASGASIEITDSGAILLSQLQLRSSSGAATGLFLNTSSGGQGKAFVSVTKCDVALGTSQVGASVGSGTLGSLNSLWRNTSTGTGISVGGVSGTPAALAFLASEVRGFTNGIAIVAGDLTTASAIPAMSSGRITCGTSAGIGLAFGSASVTTALYRANTTSSITSMDFSTCATAVRVVAASTDIASMSGSVGTTGFDARLGGVITYAKAGMTLTAGTNEVNIENGEVTGTFAAGTAGQCRVSSTSGNYSRVCAR